MLAYAAYMTLSPAARRFVDLAVECKYQGKDAPLLPADLYGELELYFDLLTHLKQRRESRKAREGGKS